MSRFKWNSICIKSLLNVPPSSSFRFSVHVLVIYSFKINKQNLTSYLMNMDLWTDLGEIRYAYSFCQELNLISINSFAYHFVSKISFFLHLKFKETPYLSSHDLEKNWRSSLIKVLCLLHYSHYWSTCFKTADFYKSIKQIRSI